MMVTCHKLYVRSALFLVIVPINAEISLIQLLFLEEIKEDVVLMEILGLVRGSLVEDLAMQMELDLLWFMEILVETLVLSLVLELVTLSLGISTHQDHLVIMVT